MNIQEIKEKFKHDRFATNQTDIEIVDVGDNYSKCSFMVKDYHLNARDSVMGGAIFTLADFAFAVAANHKDKTVVSVSANINFLKSACSKMLYAEANCVKNGSSICVYEVVVTDENNRKIAVASVTGYVV